MRANALVFTLCLSVTSGARANGRMPGANDVVFTRDDADGLIARGTFGLVRRAGEGWQWICEQAIDTSGVIADPPLGLTADGLVLLPPTGGVLVSRDRGCSWQRIESPLSDQRGVDLTHDPSAPSRLLLLGSTLHEIDARGIGSYDNVLVETSDAGASFRLLGTLATDFEAETLEVAPSEAQRIYVSGTASENPRLGVLLRSEDGGATWTRTTLDLPAGSGSMFISAIHPQDPDTLWVRVPARGDTLGILPARLYISTDKGQTFRMLADTKRGMFGFALSPDGTELAYGGPSDGLFVGPADGSGDFAQKSKLGVRCLRWPEPDRLYACASEPQDPFSLGVSRDHGESFEALYRMVDTCPAECGDDATFAEVCRTPWSAIGPFISASTLSCEVPWAAEGLRDAGTEDAGVAEQDAAAEPDDAGDEADAATTRPPAKRTSGCESGATDSSPGGALAAALALAAWAWRRRRGSR